MTSRQALHDLVDRLEDEDVERLLAEAARISRQGSRPPVDSIDLRDHAVLTQVWDNEDDEVFDTIDAR